MKHIIPILVILLLLSSGFVGVSNTAEEQWVETEEMEQSTATISGDGLMNSSWPMFCHDVQHTGRSPYAATGNTCVEKWKFQMEGMVDSSPAIDENGTLYIGSSLDCCLFAIYPNGTEKWRVNIGWSQSSPAIAEDGIIYIGSSDRNLYAIHPDGTEKWKFYAGSGVYSSPTIAEDGTIYFGVLGPGSDRGRIYAVNQNGTEKWHYDTGFWIYSSPALDNNGNIYIGSHDNYLYCLYSNGTLKWRFKAGKEVKSPPAIGDDGTIYFGSWDDYLYALYPNGTMKWKFNCYDGISLSPAIGPNGTIYVGAYTGKIFSVDPYGNENWRFQTGDWVISSPAIDKNGVIYVGSFDGTFYALNPDGTLKWKFFAGGYIDSSPAINENGTIYFVAEVWNKEFNSYLYAIEVIENEPPVKPNIDGPSTVKPRTEYTYTAVTTDPDSDNLFYYFDWGDGSGDISRRRVSGDSLMVTHIWEKVGNYIIKVKAIDEHGADGNWTTLEVTMPMNQQSQNMWFLRWLERFPLLERLLLQFFYRLLNL